MDVADGSMPRILVVEDESQMRLLLVDNLEFEGYRVAAVDNGEAALKWLGESQPSLIILDVMLPGMSGFELCREMRARRLAAPIIMLSARSEELDRVTGLDLGADDYVTKPFGVRELLARVRAQLRRDSQHTEAGDIVLGAVRVNFNHRLVTRAGQPVDLTERELELLRHLYVHRGEVVSREQILRDVWGYHEHAVTRTVDNFVAKLRVHIEPEPHDPRHILTVHGIGYKLVI